MEVCNDTAIFLNSEWLTRFRIIFYLHFFFTFANNFLLKNNIPSLALYAVKKYDRKIVTVLAAIYLEGYFRDVLYQNEAWDLFLFKTDQVAKWIERLPLKR